MADDSEKTEVETEVESPTSVLEEEGNSDKNMECRSTSEEDEVTNHVNGEEALADDNDDPLPVPLDLEAKNGDVTLITESMKEEEERLLQAHIKEEADAEAQRREAAYDPNVHFSKLDALLSQAEAYSQFLEEKISNMDGLQEDQPQEEPQQKGRKRKAKAANQYNAKRARKAVEVMLTRSQETVLAEDANLTEEERDLKEQVKLVPLLTGGVLKSYQLKGVKWLISLWQNGLSGILADQMGLGKTVQTIGFLAHLKGKGLDGPYMVIAPLSTLSNWVNEVTRFVPSMSAIIYHGSKVERAEIRRKRMPKNAGPEFPIVITSYEVAMMDAKFLAHYTWKYVIVDEGHRLKNSKCKLLRELRRLPIENKLLLTGTPLQNNLTELWSLLNFILPDIFASDKEFESWFDFKGESEETRRVQVVSKLHAILRPFLLRRMKEQVEKSIPRKKEIIIYANMTEYQKQFQEHLIDRTFCDYIKENADFVIRTAGVRSKLNNLLMQLRKNCNHPDLLQSQFDMLSDYPPVEKLLEQCGKLQLLDRLLSSLLSKGHKVLIFCQMTKVLDLLEYFLSEKGFEPCRIDGSVKLDERRRQIAEFNDSKSKVSIFLLSTRAGGLGINLTAADTCILYDSDWNPQMDLQAMDRCHRIGQTKPVHVYRLATANSVEGKIIKRAFGKLKLEHVVIGKGQFQQEKFKPNVLNDEELLALLKDQHDEEDKMIQMDISNEDLLRIMDRSDLIGAPAPCAVPLKGPGWEVVVPPTTTGGMLTALSS